jgi:U4/U6.U5 tri-snRNP-associated protein 2
VCWSDVVDGLARTKYDLVANICHDSSTDTEKKTVASAAGENPLTAGSYRAHVKNDCTGQVGFQGVRVMCRWCLVTSVLCLGLQWYEMQDLHVQETMPQLIGLSESYLLFYRFVFLCQVWEFARCCVSSTPLYRLQE